MLEACKAEALKELLLPTEDSIWRSICRTYSKTYSTPLHEVMKLDPEFVLKTYYASSLDEVSIDGNLEGLLDSLYSLRDPNFQRNKELSFEDEIKRAEEKEKKRIKEGKSVRESLRKNKTAPVEDTPPPVDGPKEGFVNFAHLNEKNEQ